jgi:hypothetical protein
MPVTSSAKKTTTAKSSTPRTAAVQPNLQRIVGYAEDPQDSSDDDPFNLDTDEEEDAILDRHAALTPAPFAQLLLCSCINNRRRVCRLM